MLSAALPVLFESSDNSAVLQDPVNEDWLAVVNTIGGECYEVLARRYYVALYHWALSRPLLNFDQAATAGSSILRNLRLPGLLLVGTERSH